MSQRKTGQFCVLGNAMNAGCMSLGEEVSNRGLIFALAMVIVIAFFVAI
jgi:hypothetical protein